MKAGEDDLARSVELDAAGRGEEALACLTRAAHVGHLGAMTLLAARRLTGRGAAFAPGAGIAMMQAAAARGGADACGVMAVLRAMGSGVPQSWPQALDLLRCAAEGGSTKAQGQLRVLAAGPAALSPLDAGETDWRGLSQAVDVPAWIAPPRKRPLCEMPRIRVLEGFASAATCRWLIARAQGRAAPALVYDPETGRGRVEETRNNSAFEMSVIDLDLVVVLLRERIAAATGLPSTAQEPTQILHYAVGQRFDRHFDFLDPANPGHAADVAQRGQRIVTFLIYLNDDFDGGGTQFPRADVTFKGAAGDGLMFANVDPAGAPDPRSLHAGTPPTRGEKWLLSQWVRDRAPAPG